MAAALRVFKPGAMRLDVSVRADGTLIIDDAYNANPVSMRGALETMADLALGGELWLLWRHVGTGRVCAAGS